MSSALRFVGRLIFVTLLLSSAVLKIKQPGSYTAEFTNGYNSIRGLHSSVSEVVPKVEQVLHPHILDHYSSANGDTRASCWGC